ncbi:MAG: cytochrome P460 family protein [Acidobacteria bacterium]|nr:cytochrome P460 family protein [Acidobacteriota bacterium]
MNLRPMLAFCVLVLGLSGCAKESPKLVAELNHGAAIRGNLPANPLAWKVITSAVDQSKQTMETLYGNDAAAGYARTHAEAQYPAGSVLSLVTWKQGEDSRWFGARTPQAVQSVEFVTVEAGAEGKPAYLYEEYLGAPLEKTLEVRSAAPAERAQYLLSQRASVLP